MHELTKLRFDKKKKKQTYHSMTLKLRVRMQNAIRRRVIASSVHSIGTSFIEGSLQHITYVLAIASKPVHRLVPRTIMNLESRETYREPNIPRFCVRYSNHFAEVCVCKLCVSIEKEEISSLDLSSPRGRLSQKSVSSVWSKEGQA